jgi:uncharacterized phage-like protein YoqJ
MALTCTFCGHSHIYGQSEIQEHLYDTVLSLVHEGYTCFFVGNYGEFDRLSAAACLKAKGSNPEIEVCLVVPYYQPHIDNLQREYYDKFDSTIVPPLENTPYRFRILKANQWMVDQADTVVAYVNTNYGGAVKTLQYAVKKSKRIINLSEVCTQAQFVK